MGFDWQGEAEREAPPRAPAIPKGQHRVEIIRLVHGGKAGPFTSRGGDPQFMIIFQDNEAREASAMITLNDRAAFVLARMMAACDPPVNLARLKEDGVEPANFVDETFAKKVLVGRQLTIDVAYESGGNGKEYAVVTPIIDRAPASPSTVDDAPSVEDDGPPPVDDVSPPPPASMTRAEAWEAVKTSWAAYAGPEKKEKLDAAWRQAFAQIGKPQPSMTGEDWARVADLACTPF